MHLRIPLPFLVLGGAGNSDQGVIDDRALFHGHAALLEMGFYRLEDLPSKFILLKQVQESQDRCLIWDTVADLVDSSEKAHDG